MRNRWFGQRLTIQADVPPGMVGRPYTATLTAAGGRPPYRWTIADDDALPLGLSLESAGTVSGIPEPAAAGAASFVVTVTDSEDNAKRSELTLIIESALEISPAIDVSAAGNNLSYVAELHASGGLPPYRWGWPPGYVHPGGLTLTTAGVISGIASSPGTVPLAVQVTDAGGFAESAGFAIRVRRSSVLSRAAGRMRRNAATLTPRSAGLSVRIRGRAGRSGWLSWLHSTTTLLSILSIGLPTFATLFILAYTFARSGPHLSYFGVGMMVGLAAFMAGILAGFLFGIPRVVSLGDLRHKKAASDYAPSSNLAEVSDWLTKLLLGAGLVQLTHLGGPIARLIDDVAAGLHHGEGSQSATVMAGAILIGYTTIGLLDGYVVTTVWYQRKISKL